MLSAIVITYNEEANIKRCLTSLAFADEIIVVDANSTDNTTVIAKQCGARVYVNEWRGYGQQKNYGAKRANGDWLFFVDADEEVSTSLVDAIKMITEASTDVDRRDFYWLRIVTVFMDKPLRHLFGHNVRLFRKDAGQWTTAKVHEQVVTNGGHLIKLGDDKSGLIKTQLLHHSHKTISSYVKKMHKYTTLDAKEMSLTKKHRSGKSVKSSPLLPLQLSAKQFVKLLIYKRGVLDGISGIVWCVLSAFYEYEMAKKYLVLVSSH